MATDAAVVRRRVNGRLLPNPHPLAHGPSPHWPLAPGAGGRSPPRRDATSTRRSRRGVYLSERVFIVAEEEIDVVSISEKSGQMNVSTRTESLPRVPSALDRHNIQRTVASAITSRRVPTTPPRKRMPPSAAASAAPAYSPTRKRTRGPGRRPRRSSPDTDSDPDVPDLEKRSLHNDMERMRRIGLKNLFDQLKEQIPATRDKERAPKVVILREAASLCRRLQAEEREREALRRHQTRLLAKLKKLRSIHAAARSHAHPVHATHHAAPTVWAH
ncbi:Myc protein [Eumeta japonica]|uniref:Myc protein n=1 Tax=Eumeta variegata TaxID=151549 RepID=A0A4C1V361_EUMVA|nr:Myc protein [Eumeta japonica]